MPDWLITAFTAVFGGVVLALLCWIASKVTMQLAEFRKEHKELVEIKEEFQKYREEHAILMESQRNQLKSDIVKTYEQAKSRGDKMTYMELDTMNRSADSYFALGGNHYIHTIIAKANKMDLFGEVIPINN